MIESQNLNAARGAANWERGLSADALEALVGAMHLDAGFEAARRFVEWVLDDAASVGAAHIDGNYKVPGLFRMRSASVRQASHLVARSLFGSQAI